MLTPQIMAGRAIDDKFKQESDLLRNAGYDVYSDSIFNPSFSGSAFSCMKIIFSSLLV